MYNFRRGNRWWFRKVTPIDVLSPPEGFGRAGGVGAVYEVLRSERPLEPARSVLAAFVEHAKTNAAGAVLPPIALPALDRAAAVAGTASAEPTSNGQAMIPSGTRTGLIT